MDAGYPGTETGNARVDGGSHMGSILGLCLGAAGCDDWGVSGDLVQGGG